MVFPTVNRGVSFPIAEDSLFDYFKAIKKFPILSPEEEYMLAKRFAEHDDSDAAHKLVTSHLRLVAKIAFNYRSNNVPMLDLISEGNIGLMRAVKKFDPDKGFRLATYAVWWIKAAIKEYLVSTWSLVRLGTTATQRRLFFNLRKLKAKLGLYDGAALSPESTKTIADALSVPIEEVIEMDGRLRQSDASLNQSVEDGEMEHIDMLADSRSDQETMVGEREELNQRKQLLRESMGCLSARERNIIEGRRLSEKPRTLDAIGLEYGISRERVRQIENAAFEKLQKAVLSRTVALGRPEMAPLATVAATYRPSMSAVHAS